MMPVRSLGAPTPSGSVRARTRQTAASTWRRHQFRPTLPEALEARIQMDAATVVIGKPGAQIQFVGDFATVPDATNHRTTYTSKDGTSTVGAILGQDNNFHSLIRVLGPTSFEKYDSGYEPADDAGSFTIGTDQAAAKFGVFLDTAAQSPLDVWQGKQTFDLEKLFEPGVTVDVAGSISERIDGSAFDTSSIQLVGARGSDGVQAHLRGRSGFDDAQGPTTQVIGSDYARLGPFVGASLDIESAGGESNPFKVKNFSFNPHSLHLIHVPGTDKWEFFADLELKLGAFTFVGKMGKDEEHPGLTFEDGKLTEFNFDLTTTTDVHSKLGAPGVSIAGAGANTKVASKGGEYGMFYDKDTKNFAVYGTAFYQGVVNPSSGKISPPNFELDFGSIQHPGFATDGNDINSFAIGVSTHFSLGPVEISTNHAGLSYTHSTEDGKPSTLALYGGASIQFSKNWAGASFQFGTDVDHPGLIVNLDTGQITLDSLSVAIAYLPVGGLVFQNLGFTYDKPEGSSDFEIKVNGTLILPAGWGVSVAFAFNDRGLESIAGGFTAAYDNPGIEIGDTGLSLYSAYLAVNNIENPEEISVAGTATFIYGDVVTVDGIEVTPFVAVGSFYVDRHKLELDGDVYMMAYDTARPATPPPNGQVPTPVWKSAVGSRADASMNLDWSAGIYRLAVNNLTILDTFVVSGSITFDSHGDVVLAAEADVQVPTIVPIIGGTHIAGLDFLFVYDAQGRRGFVAAWASINLVFISYEGGFEYAFDQQGTNHFSLIGAAQIGELQQEAAGVIGGNRKDADGQPLFSYPSKPRTITDDMQADGLTFEVDTPDYNVNGSIELTVPGRADPLALTVGGSPLPWYSPDGATRLLAQADRINGRIVVSVYPGPSFTSATVPAGDYKVTLVSREQFVASDVAFSTLLRYLPPVQLKPLLALRGADAAATPVTTLDVVFGGKVAKGLVKPLNKKATVRVFVDANNDGVDYNGVQVGQYTTMLNDDGTWTQPATVDFNRYRYDSDVRLYATVDDTTNPVAYSQVVSNLVAAPLISGTATAVRPISPPINPPDVTSVGPMPGLLAFIDLNHDGKYDAVSGSEAGGDLVLEPAAVTDVLGGFRIDPSQFFLDAARTRPALVAGQTYEVVLALPSGQYQAIVNGVPTPNAVARAYFTYDGTSPTLSPIQVYAPTTIRGTVYDDPAGNLDGTDPGTLLLTAHGASGQTVFLDLNNNGQPDAGEPSTSTGASGQYAFYDGSSGVALTAGTAYTVRLVQAPHTLPSAATSRTAAVATANGQSAFNDFFVRRQGSVSGVVQGYPSGMSPTNPGLIDLSVPIAGRTVSAAVDVVDYRNFTNSTDLTPLSLVGSARVTDFHGQQALFPAYQTQGNTHAAGAAWLADPITLGGGFEAGFQWGTTQENGPIQNGFSFVIQGRGDTVLPADKDLPPNPTGFEGIADSYAVVFDLNNNNISIWLTEQNGTPYLLAQVGTADIGTSLQLGVHSARILYQAGTLSVFLDGSQSPLVNNNPGGYADGNHPGLQAILSGNAPAYLGLVSAYPTSFDSERGSAFIGFRVRQIVASTTTAADGSYTLPDLLPDVDYQIIQQVPPGWRQVGAGPVDVGYTQTQVGSINATSGATKLFSPTTADVDGDGIPDLVYGAVYQPYDTLQAPGYLIAYGDGRGGVRQYVAHYFSGRDSQRFSLSSITDIRIIAGHFDASLDNNVDRASFMFLVNGGDNAGQKGIGGLVDLDAQGDYILRKLFRPKAGQLIEDAARINFYRNSVTGASSTPAGIPGVATLDDELIFTARGADGYQDVYFTSPFAVETLSDFYGNFLLPAIPNLLQSDISVAAGDINGDGYDDFVLFLPDFQGDHAFIPRFYFGTGDPGHFQSYDDDAIKIAATDRPVVALGDLNGDGRLDLVVAATDDQGNATIEYALQAAGRTFTLGQVQGSGGMVTDQAVVSGASTKDTPLARMAVTDLDGDGLGDLAIVSGGNRRITTFLNRGGAFFDRARRVEQSAGDVISGPHPLALADFNRDGLPDLIAGVGDNGYGSGISSASVLLSDAVSQAATQVRLDSGQAIRGVDFRSAEIHPTGLGATPAGDRVISGVVYRDTARDGRRGGSDRGVAGVRVYLDSNGNGLLDNGETSTLTSADGTYRIAGLAAGTIYEVRLDLPSTLHATTSPGGAAVMPGTAESPRFQDFGVAAPWFKGLPDLVRPDLTRLVVDPVRTNDAPPGEILFRLGANAPDGMTIDPYTGRILWTPTADQAPGTYVVTVIAGRAGAVAAEDSQAFAVTLPNVNHAPTLRPIVGQTVAEGQTLTVTAVGADRDAGQSLTYSLDPGAPAGMTIDPRTGVISWAADDRRASGLVNVRVTDNGDPSLSTTTSFRLTVQAVAPIVFLLPGPARTDANRILALDGSFVAPGRTGWTATVDYGDGSGPTPLGLRANRTFALAHAYAAAGSYRITVTVTDFDGLSGTAGASVLVSPGVTVPVMPVLPPVPRVIAAVVGDGVDANIAQRSNLSELVVTFDRVVSVAAGAFVLRNQGGRVVPLKVSFAVVDGRTIVTLTFSPTLLDGKSLADGRYSLTIRRNRVRDPLGVAIGETPRISFCRVFGDLDGDGRVDRSEVQASRAAVGSHRGDANYRAELDLSGSGKIRRGVYRRVLDAFRHGRR